MFERFKKQSTPETTTPARQPSDIDPRIGLYTKEELDQAANFAAVLRNQYGPDGKPAGIKAEAGWRKMGENETGDLFELHRVVRSGDGSEQTLVKIQTADDLLSAQLELDRAQAARHAAEERSRFEHQMRRDRALGDAAKRLASQSVELPRDGDGLIVMPNWDAKK